MYKIILILFVFVFLCSCNEEKQNNPKQESKEYEILPDQISWDPVVRFIDSSYTKAVLHAGRGRIFQSRQETILDSGLVVEFFEKESGNRVSKLVADSAIIDDKTKNMLASGNVVVISDSSNTKLETSVLQWDNETQKIYSTEFVTITNDYEIIKGYGFESDQSLKYYKVINLSIRQTKQLEKR